jgi:hypothetical protein
MKALGTEEVIAFALRLPTITVESTHEGSVISSVAAAELVEAHAPAMSTSNAKTLAEPLLRAAGSGKASEASIVNLR